MPIVVVLGILVFLVGFVVCLAGCGGVNCKPAPDSVERELPERDEKIASPSITVQASANALENLHAWVGDANQVTLRDALTVNQSGLKIDLPSGANLSYEMSDAKGVFLFDDPKPIVHARLAGIPFGAPLNQVVLLPDGTGSAAVQVGPFQKQTPPFRWLTVEGQDSGSGAPSPSAPPEDPPQKFVRNQAYKCPCGCGQVPCRCPGCVDVGMRAAAVPERRHRGVIVTMDSRRCPPCKTVKEVAIPKLAEAGWLVNKGPQSHLLILDYEEDAVAIETLKHLPGAQEASSLPVFIRIEDNRVTAQHEGALEAWQIAEFVYPQLRTRNTGPPAASAAGAVCPRCGKVHR